MRVYVFSLLAVLFGSQLFAQSYNASLYVQSPNGKTVKLVWFIKNWNNDLKGFDIKRKEGLQDWVKLNNEPIVPGISMKKKLSVVDADKNEENMLKAKLYKLLISRKLKETDDIDYIQKLTTDNKALQDINEMMMHDYDLALMFGFAFVDHSAKQKTDYQYGLFIQGTNTLLANASWNYGEIPDLNAVKEVTSRGTSSVKGVQLVWKADQNKVKASNILGFNVYRQGIRLNTDPVVASGDGTEFTWYDKSANTSGPIQYSISAESIFGIEGIIKPYTYNPTEHPGEYKKAVVTEISSIGYYFKEGINVKWTFPREDEHFLKGFYVEKENALGGYKRVSSLLDPSARSFNDQTSSSVNEYVRFHIIAVYTDLTEQPGVARLYSYFPITEPPVPQHFKVKTNWADKKLAVHLTWDPAIPGDNVTDHYQVYVMRAGDDRFNPLNDGHGLKSAGYNYTIQHGTAGVYKYCVTAFSASGTEGRRSDTVAIQVPTLELPAPAITKVAADSIGVTIEWQYNDIPDLKGFRLFKNKTMIASENILRKGARQFTLPKPDDGTYEFTLRAVTEYGILSDLSSPGSITVEKTAGK